MGRPRTIGVALLAAASTTAAAPAVAPAKSLERGDRGKRVKVLQRALGLTADGVFGPGTERALVRWQRRHHLTADGKAGRATFRMLRRVRAARAASGRVRVSSRGGSVKVLQRRLGVSADGVFGPGTSRAVKRFQRRRGLTADGVVGPATWRALGVRGTRPVLRRAGTPRRTRSGPPASVLRMIAAANRIARMPYRLGGGHGSFRDDAYDCSGSVSYVLHGGGRLGRTRTSGELMRYGAPGPGRYVTVYAHPGHTFITIMGRRYDTTGRQLTGSRWQRAMRSTRGYVVRHPPGL